MTDALDDTLLLGFQGSRQAGLEQALGVRTARIGGMAVRDAIGPEGPLVSLWSVRGAPHTHRVFGSMWSATHSLSATPKTAVHRS